MRAETAKSGHTLHPAICKSDAPELRVVVVACGRGHGEAMRKSELPYIVSGVEMQPPRNVLRQVLTKTGSV